MGNKVKQLQRYYYCNYFMSEQLRLSGHCLSAEKAPLTPRLTSHRKYSVRKPFNVNKSQIFINPNLSQQPVNSYSFIRRSHVNSHSDYARKNYSHSSFQPLLTNTANTASPTTRLNLLQLKRVQSIKISPKVVFDTQLALRNKTQNSELGEILVIRPVPCSQRIPQNTQKNPKRDTLCGKGKSSFLEFYNARKRSIKVHQSPQKLEGMLQRFLMIRKTNLQTEQII